MVKMRTQTMSTKCQYKPTSSTVSARSCCNLAPETQEQKRRQHDHSAGDVGAVKAGQRVER